ncbi:MAG: ferritin-like domain-containing protein [Firmicutes bacterium]|nr:ferritin-like domain-containing protein [Bacillota bacterium]
MIQVHPEMDDERLVALFDKSVHRQWAQDAVAWEDFDRVPASVRKDLAMVLTPVYLGEQTAMVGVATVIPMLLMRGEHEASLCLAGMELDEARHFRILNHLYRLFGHEPMPSRRLPEMWRYHARLLKSRDPMEWVWGILISDLFARRFYKAVGELDPQGLLGALTRRILQDEARHQAFSDLYLERELPTAAPERRRALLDERDDLFRVMDALATRLSANANALGIDHDALLDGLWSDTERWADRLGLGATGRPRPHGGAVSRGRAS